MDGDVLRRVVELALEAADAERATERVLSGRALVAPLRVLAVGKAARGMARAAQRALGDPPTLVIAPEGTAPLPHATTLTAAHPLPDARSVAAADAALAFVAEPCATLVVLLSGGGSSLMERPLPGVELEDLRRVSALLEKRGADIGRWNAVRGALSAVKHGRLLAAARAERVVNVVISDVPGQPPSVVASGPTSPAPPIDPQHIAALLGRPLDVSPAQVTAPETWVAASAESVRDAVAASLLSERRLPSVHVHRPVITGAAHVAARQLAALFEATPEAALVAAGEVTVDVRGDGCGGPASTLALHLLRDTPHRALALGTDGIDGSSRAAGAVVTDDVRERAASLGLDPGAFLARDDAATFFAQTGGAIVTGPTGTNTAELYVLSR